MKTRLAILASALFMTFSHPTYAHQPALLALDASISSKVKVLETSYYDAGYGSKFNSEVRCSTKIQNASSATLGRVTLYVDYDDATGKPVQSWKVYVGTMAPGQIFSYETPLWRNTMMIPLNPKVRIEGE